MQFGFTLLNCLFLIYLQYLCHILTANLLKNMSIWWMKYYPTVLSFTNISLNHSLIWGYFYLFYELFPMWLFSYVFVRTPHTFRVWVICHISSFSLLWCTFFYSPPIDFYTIKSIFVFIFSALDVMLKIGIILIVHKC